MPTENQIYHLKVDSSGRIVLPADVRARNFISEGDSLIMVADEHGLHVKTRGQIKAEVQAYFATLAPANVILSDEILADRRTESEHD